MKKFTALLLSLSMIFSLCSCTGNSSSNTTSMANGDVDIVINDEGIIDETENTPWYHLSPYVIESEYMDGYYTQVSNDVLSADNTSILTLVGGYIFNSEGIPFGEEGFQTEFIHLCKYDFITGERTFFLDLSDYQKYIEDEDGQQDYQVIKTLEGEDCFYLIYQYNNYSNNICEYHVAKFSSDGNLIEDTIPSNLAQKMTSGSTIFGSAVDGTRVVFLTGNWSSDSPIANPRIISYDVATDDAQSCAMGSGLTAAGAVSIYGLRKIDSNNYGVIAYDANNNPLCLHVDISDMSTEMIDMSVALVDVTDDLTSLYWSIPTNSYSYSLSLQGDDCIVYYNLETDTFEKSLDLNHCNHNGYLLQNGAGAVESNSDYTVMVDGLFSPYGNGMMGVFLFEKLDNNPFVGRTLLTASAIGRYVSYGECEIIYQYNELQDQYYVAIDNSYVIDNSEEYYSNYGTYIESASQMTAQLAVDLMAGNGPDIILDGFDFEELNKDDCLIDLMPYLEDAGVMNNELYYSNVFNLAMDENGAVYQVPIGFSLGGIRGGQIDSIDSYVSVGYTFEEYISLISNECNGYDFLSDNRDQINYFILLYNGMRNDFISDGQINLDNDSFYALAEYVRDNVNDANFEMEYSNYFYSLFGTCGLLKPGPIFVARGIPSVDGRGPLLVANNSIGVSSLCVDVNGAIDFILFALGEEAQSIDSQGFCNPVRRDCTRILLEQMSEDSIRRSVVQELEDPTYRPYIYTEDDIDMSLEFFSMEVDSASGYFGGDSDITMILYEEMQAYFAGDKSLDEIIPIIEDRCQTVLNERG